MELIIMILAISLVGYILGYLAWYLITMQQMKAMSEEASLLEVVLEKDTETNHLSVEQMWASFYSGLYIPWYKRPFQPQPHITFEIKSEHTVSKKKKEITFNFWVPQSFESMIRQRILGLYPKAQVRTLDLERDDYIPNEDDTIRAVETAELGLREDSAFSIKLFKDFEADPLSSITSSMSQLENKEIAVIQMVMRPLSPSWKRKAERILVKYERTGKRPNRIPEWVNATSFLFIGIFKLIQGILDTIFASKAPEGKPDMGNSSLDKDKQKEMLEKVRRNPFAFQVRVLVGSPLGQEEAKEKVRNIIASFKELDGPNNGFEKEFILNKKRTYTRMKHRHFNVTNNDDVLTAVELAGFAHLPNKTNFTPGLKKIQSKRTEFPADVSEDNAFAYAMDTQGNERRVGLDLNGRMRHVYVSGMTGVGKSTLLENMIVSDIENNKCVVVVDPHGELVDEVLHKISTDREDIFVLDPADIKHPFGMNLLELSSNDPIQREMEKILVVDAYITAMKRVFGEGAIGPNTDDIFRMGCSAILDTPDGGGLLEMLLILTSDAYRARVIQHIKDPVVRNYWEVVFPTLAGQGKFLVQNLNAPLNKIRRFIANGLVSNIICQKKSTLNIADTINNGGVILARFSRGDMGFENSALLGTMLISKIQIAAMQRVNIPQEQRVPTFLYVDEFQNFVGDQGGAKSFAEILSEARKYRLGLIIAHQFIDQLKQTGSNFLTAAIFNNCGTTISFRMGTPDAKFVEDMYYDKDTEKGFKGNDITSLGLGEIVMRVVTKAGIQSQPFIARTFMPLKASDKANADLIRKRSRSIIGVRREVVRGSIEERMKGDSMSDIRS